MLNSASDSARPPNTSLGGKSLLKTWNVIWQSFVRHVVYGPIRLPRLKWSGARPADTLHWKLVFHHNYTVTLSLPGTLISAGVFPACWNQFGLRFFFFGGGWITVKSVVKFSSPGSSQGYIYEKKKRNTVYHISSASTERRTSCSQTRSSPLEQMQTSVLCLSSGN